MVDLRVRLDLLELPESVEHLLTGENRDHLVCLDHLDLEDLLDLG